MTTFPYVPPNDWTAERVATLHKLFADGLSAGAIAAELGGVTRNAVIGKLRRLGLRLSQKAKGRPLGSHNRVRKGRRHPFKPWKPSIIEQIPPAPNIKLPPEPVANPVTLMQLEGFHCRWPIGDPQSPDFRFCGADKYDHAYCIKHVRMAYSQPMTPAERGLAMANMRRARAA